MNLTSFLEDVYEIINKNHVYETSVETIISSDKLISFFDGIQSKKPEIFFFIECYGNVNRYMYSTSSRCRGFIAFYFL